MKNNKKGFTLIELLVVVLIIGILSSVALPQYTKAVDKARGTEALTNIKAWADAQNIYYMGNTGYTSDASDLDIQLPDMKYFSGSHEGFSGSSGSTGSSITLVLRSAQKNAALKYSLSRGKITSRYCTGSDCSNFFNCTSSSNNTCVLN